jgi:hypothetical protein
MSLITKGMSREKAWGLLERSNKSQPQLLQIARSLKHGSGHLRQPKGYSGIDGARKMLNDMIFQAMLNYDTEIARCTQFYSEQCASMEVCRGQIASSNYVAANARSLILDSQATINKCEADIPNLKLDLKQNKLKCKHEIHKMNERLKILRGDISVMTAILSMTDCKKSLMQMDDRKDSIVGLNARRCEDPCTKESFITFDHDALQQKVSQLQSQTSHDLMQENLGDLFEGAQVVYQQVPVNKTKFNNPPIPRTDVPANPCTDPNAGGPPTGKKRASKCSLSGTPQCYKLQERFLLIQSGIEDERDDLLEEINQMEKSCADTEKSIEGEIGQCKDMLDNAQTSLASAMTKEANAGEIARQTAKTHDQLNADLVREMKTCSANYIGLESELCALKKIRGELYLKIKGLASAFFVDCSVGKWEAEECDKVCAGGTQKLERKVMTHPNGGAKCLPLTAVRSCNNHPCPVDCKLEAWSGWSKCSAECGGGVSQRLREVRVADRYGGKPCSETSETIACNNQACEKDCELTGWTKWSKCSKDCDGGTTKRVKYIKSKAQGDGKCPGAWSKSRLNYKECNVQTCPLPKGRLVMSCTRELDIVLLIDGSGSLGSKGWAAEIKGVQMFLDAFNVAGGNSKISVIVYSGPRTWGGVHKCFGNNKKKIDMEKDCSITTVAHFTDKIDDLKTKVAGLTWPKGSTLTSLALMTALAELNLGRKNAHSNVILFTDGRPLSYRRTHYAARAVRKAARLVWVPVTRFAPLKYIKKWATRRWEENVVVVKTFKDLESPDPINQIVANICPKVAVGAGGR